MLKPRPLALMLMIVAAAASRLVPHLPNMTPIAAIALFAGASFADKRLAFLVPLMALLLSDMVLGFYSGLVFVYGSFALSVIIGLWLQKRRAAPVILGSILASSCLFFVITNFGVWVMDNMYPHSLAGLVTCYVAAIPFFRNEVVGDLLYGGLLFGGFALLEMLLPVLRPPARAAA